MSLRAAVALAVAVSALAIRAPDVSAKSCGGGKECQCGDTVAADYTLDRDLGPCPGHGLLVHSNATLDCHGFKITGLGNGSKQFGIFLDGEPGGEVAGATVKNCEVSGFLRGIRLRAAHDNVIADNTSAHNGDTNAHVGYGIDVSGGSRNNLLERNRVRDNADEGIHVGIGSHRNRLVGNVSQDNHREDLYVLGNEGGAFIDNTLGGGGSNSLYLKDSSHNRFERNTFHTKVARVIGASHDNEFIDNTFRGAGLHFTYYRPTGARPSNNRVTGGAIRDTAECLRFTSSSGAIVSDTALSECRLDIRADSPAGPSDNTVVGQAPRKVALDAGSTIRLASRVTVTVRDAAGAPVSGAEVEARDVDGGKAFSATTDETGAIPPQIVVGSVLTGDRTLPRTPHTITVKKTGYAPEVRTVAVTEHVTVAVSLAAP
jgi:parallel beta-helix repeat protein